MAFTLGAIFGLTASLTHPARWQVALVICALLAIMLYDAVQLRRHQESSF